MIRIARTLVAADLQVSMAYKLNFFLGILSVMVLFLVHFNLWKVIFEGHDSDTIGGYTFSEMLVYVGSCRRNVRLKTACHKLRQWSMDPYQLLS